MRKQIFTVLLVLAATVLLTACSATGSRPGGREGAGRGGRAPGEAEPSERDQTLARQLPAAQKLAEVERLARQLTHYQPDILLAVLRHLQSIPSTQLKSAVAGGRYGDDFKQWLDLALEVRASVFDGHSIEGAARRWAENHPGHVIDRTAFADIATIYRSQFSSPAQVAVLLPAGGGLQAAARAIRDGILNAYFENPGHSMLRFYDSGDSTAAAAAAYQRAQAEGATQVIGPLRVESTLALGSQPAAGVPILLLNDNSTGQNGGGMPGVNSLTLSQSEEAGAVADRALDRAQHRAIVLVPDNAWGTRIESAFQERFAAGAGRIVDGARFDNSGTEQDTMLTQLLGIEASRSRKQALQAWLGIPLGFEPYRRHDFDFIFLAASPEVGRQIKPLLRFYDAGDIPVYAMGRIYSGRVAATADRDLDGIVFPITPWQLRAANRSGLGRAKLPESALSSGYENLYALGLDAWRVLPWLDLLRQDPGLTYPGQTGFLKLLDDGHLHREPAWARFSAGRPLPYHWPQGS